jgi:DNA polymerase I-like protein with 3'-5' exonuclease and polymerase domains
MKILGKVIIYGITKYGLSYKIKSSVDAAQVVIDDFRAATPAVTLFFKKMADFTVNQGYTPESGLGTARFIQKKRLAYDKEAVMRESGNFNIQGVGAGILKVATSLMRRHIRHHDMVDKALIVLTPYDEIVMDVEDSLVDYWKVKLPYFMELAAKLVLGSDILKADTPAVGDFWIH